MSFRLTILLVPLAQLNVIKADKEQKRKAKDKERAVVAAKKRAVEEEGRVARRKEELKKVRGRQMACPTSHPFFCSFHL